ncbi:MAG: hypothetical protein CL678_03165 [Bdellovibrionaceae bacterium]|nr:hypothetical protein [Pseudobdellovibrionaceae bacterium]|tara:strand:+ start:1237 stop:2115 length:879 start_codon:yes stop_codon:yes gene_type:complete
MRKRNLFSVSGSFVGLLCLSLMVTGCQSLKALYKEIKRAGYIHYETPLEKSGPGTLVGGSPKRLSLVAPPGRCFPEDLVIQDHTTLPERTQSIHVSGKAKLGLIRFLNTGNPILGAGANFNVVQTMSMKMEGVHVEYFDSIALTEYYRESMSSMCKEYLENVGFIIQALKVDQLTFEFYRKSGAKIDFSLEELEKILELKLNVDFEIIENTKLVIRTPKYIGYQLGRLIAEDNGVALYRATRVKRNQFYFESLGLFETSRFWADWFRTEEPESEGEKLDPSLYTDQYSVYLD